MIETVDKMLLEWARWRLGGRAGYAQVPWAKLMTECEVFDHGRRSYIPVNELSCQQIDRCVAALSQRRPKQHQAIELWYLHGGLLMAERCRRARCSRDALYERLHRAHSSIQVMLHDWVVNGVPPLSRSDVRNSLQKGIDEPLQSRHTPATLG